MERKTYRVDVKVYERAMASEFPLMVMESGEKFVREGHLVLGYHTIYVEATEDEMEDLCDKIHGYAKIIGYDEATGKIPDKFNISRIS